MDFFVSHAGADRAWAEWVAWQLTEAGYTVELDVWDWAAGRNFITAMSDALDGCDRVVALFSAPYFKRERYTTDEWTAAALHVPGTGEGRLVPLRVEEVPTALMPGVLRPLVFKDLFGIDEQQARQVLLDAVVGPRRPDHQPTFPGHGATGTASRLGGTGPRLPGSVPRVWNIPARNPGFTGRDGLLMAVRERLLDGNRAVVQAFHGMGGVGKTQLAIEYAHRFAGSYGLSWWINSEQPGLISDQFAALGDMLGCLQPGASAEAVQATVLGELRDRGRWLLIFDNAESPVDIRAWLPGGNGHVLITSREHNWAEIAAPVEVDVLARAESAAILQSRIPGLSAADANQLADQLGDLALAVAQASGFMAETGMPAAECLELLRARAGQLLAQIPAGADYPRSLAATTQLIADRLAAEDPAAAELASLCAFFAPEPIPEHLFTSVLDELPGELAVRAADPLTWRQTLSHLARQSLVRIDQRGLTMHRLTQAILRDRLTTGQAAATRRRSEAILAASYPGDPQDASSWGKWARLMPHLLEADLGATTNSALRALAESASWYLRARGDDRSSHDLTSRLFQLWGDSLGPDDPDTMSMGASFALTLRSMGEVEAARHLNEDILDRRRRVLGDDDHDTLMSANHLANDLYGLGEFQAAYDLYRETLSHCRRVLGENHKSTLGTASNVADALYELGEVQAARSLGEDILDRRRRFLGVDHPHSLDSASHLAMYLRALGELLAARDLDEDTLEQRRRVLGDDHPDTLGSADDLAADLRALREADDDS